jgi:ornithine cyclodeaminase/alanine dehydrogenase
MDTLLLNQKRIEALVSMDDVLDIVENTFRGMGEGTIVNPAKLTLDLGETAAWPPYNGFMNAMPAYVGWLDSAGIKWVGGFLDNGRAGLPYLSAMILLIDPMNGRFLCAMEGALITNMRTGAQTAIALKYLLPAKSITIGLYGAGAQGRTQVLAISRAFAIEKLVVYDVSPEAAKAQAVISVTQAKEKFIRRSWIGPGTVLFPMGSYQECEDSVILSADRIIVDHVEQCMHRGALRGLAASGRIAPKNIFATIGEIVAGRKVVSAVADKRIICVPVGTGAMDVAVATVAMRRAKEKGMGSLFAFC